MCQEVFSGLRDKTDTVTALVGLIPAEETDGKHIMPLALGPCRGQ